MVKVKSIQLSSEEGRKIAEIMYEKGLVQKSLAQATNVSQSLIAQILHSRTGFSPDTAKRIYDSLGKDHRLNFLVNYIDQELSHDADAWDRLYNEIALRLKRAYGNAGHGRGEIIAELEKLAAKYEGKK